MADANLDSVRQAAERPWIINVPNQASNDAKVFIASLVSSPFDDVDDSPDSLLLWGSPLAGGDAGTAYVVSAEAYKRFVAQRFEPV